MSKTWIENGWLPTANFAKARRLVGDEEQWDIDEEEWEGKWEENLAFGGRAGTHPHQLCIFKKDNNGIWEADNLIIASNEYRRSERAAQWESHEEIMLGYNYQHYELPDEELQYFDLDDPMEWN